MPVRIRNFCSCQDHRISVDFGMLCILAANGRSLSSCSLYGPKPPPNDSLWAKAKACGINVIIHERRGKAKMQFIPDLMHMALNAQKTEAVLILLTGDTVFRTHYLTALKIMMELCGCTTKIPTRIFIDYT